jgi:hypothetical protein
LRSTPPRWFCTARASIGTESSNQGDRFAAKTILETIGEATLAVAAILRR